jgi:MFS family permease
VSLPFKAWLLTSLYLAQGLPYGFFTQALPVLLREQGLSLKAISATTLLFGPWALKFAWAPLMDHTGNRRQWLLALQCAAVFGAVALSFVNLSAALWILLLALFLFNLVSATQDIVTDGLAVNLLSPRERGLGNGIQVGGYRIGMILGGGLLLWVFAKAGWQVMFACMAALLALSVLPVLALRETAAKTAGDRPAMRALAAGWWTRLCQPGVPVFIALICLYKFGDSMGASLVGPFMHDSGLSKEQIALIKGTLGSVATLGGAAIGGWICWRLGRRAALLSSGLLQTVSLMLYAWAAFGNGSLALITTACVAEHVLGGMAVVALFTLMMDASDPDHAGTDYTLLSCALVLGHGAAAFTGAVIADAAGYGALFAASVGVSALGCVALVRAIDRGAGPRRLRTVWPQRIRSELDATPPQPAA